MKRLYIVSGDDVRREPATLEEIRRFLDGSAPRSWRDDQLSRITLGDDGAIVATPLTPDELQALRAEIDRLRREHLVRLCDLGLQSDRGESLTGISFSPATILVWADEAPWAVEVVRAWAAERGLEITDSNPPRTGKTWVPYTYVRVPGRSDEIVRIRFGEVELGEKAVTHEIAGIAIANGMNSEAPF